ncbi:MAG: hypothetical protein V2I33_07375 [Kangiellaceae bacterium]|jgi:hypothetical protein|nr:hypothetical protein [Kangiellaceae bacterium]
MIGKNKGITKIQIKHDPVIASLNKVKFTIEPAGDRKKLIGTSKDPEEKFRSFAYFTTNIYIAKTAILAEYAYK